jgi:hypothetical protein
MTNASEQPETGISDEQLPEDLQPTEENPLAQPLDDDVESPDLSEGKQIEGQERDEESGGDADDSGEADPRP